MNYSGYMFIHLSCYVYMHCSVTAFSPSIYNTISSLQKRVPSHPTNVKACNSLRCQKNVTPQISDNESRTQTAVWLYLILCQVQAVCYNIYMDNAFYLILCQVQTVCYNICMDNALYLILCQVQTVCYNIYMNDALYLILCQVQTVPYNIYMDNALYSILCQVQTVPYNIYMDNALYSLLCQIQTVPYNIYMDDIWSECNWTVSLQKEITQHNYAKLPKIMQRLLQWSWCGASRESPCKFFGWARQLAKVMLAMQTVKQRPPAGSVSAVPLRACMGIKKCP